MDIGERRGKRDRGFTDMKQEMLWIEWQTLAGAYTDDKLMIGEWFHDIIKKYSEPHRKYHNLEHIYQMILNHKHFVQQLTFPKTVLFAIFFHDYEYDPKRSDNEELSVVAFERCGEELNLDPELIRDVRDMITTTSTGHQTEEHDAAGSTRSRDIHYFLDFDLAILGANPIEYTLYARKIRQEYAHVPEQEFCERRAAVMGRFIERKFVFATREFREFAEENARKNVRSEVDMLRGRAEHLEKAKTHTCNDCDNIESVE